MSKDNILHVANTTPDILDDRLETLKTIIPEAFSEGKIDFEKLRTIMGDTTADRPERYSFTWAGKKDAIRMLQSPSHAALIPIEEESVDFNTTQNIFIEGDNLEVLKLLYKPYFGQVKLIYIDPPYNTGNDFVYPDNYSDTLDNYLRLTGQKDAEGNILSSNPESGGRYHSAWLSMMYPRLFLARQLLREDGVIFVSIDDHEAYNLRLIMNEIYGEENFVDCVVWQKKVSPSNDAKWFSSDHDYLMVYAKSKEIWRPQRLKRTEKQRGYYKNPDNDPRGDWNSATYTCNKSKEQRPNLYYPVINPNTKEKIWPRETAVWAYSKDEHQKHVDENRIYWGVDGRAKMPRLKTFLFDARDVVPRSIWPYTEVGHTQEATREFMSFFPKGGFDSPKPTRLIKRVLQISSNSDDIVLDFFSGSCTTAQAVLELNHEDSSNRRFIMVQLPEPTKNIEYSTIADIGKERIHHVISRIKKENEGKLALHKTEDLGFKVFKLSKSNFHQWPNESIGEASTYTKQMEMFTDPLRDGWNENEVIFEVAIKEGFGLGINIEKSVVEQILMVKDRDRGQFFYITLAKSINLNDLRPLNLKADDFFICRDIALDDETAANLALQCRLKII